MIQICSQDGTGPLPMNRAVSLPGRGADLRSAGGGALGSESDSPPRAEGSGCRMSSPPEEAGTGRPEVCPTGAVLHKLPPGTSGACQPVRINLNAHWNKKS